MHEVAAADKKPDNSGIEFFEKRIRPVLVQHCYECHSAATKEPKGMLRLDSRDAARAGGESGPAVVPGKPEESLLVSALRHDGYEMPPGKKLPDATVADFIRWIEMDAPDPREKAATAEEAAGEAWEAQYAERVGWWSLRSVRAAPLPEVPDAAWCENSIDRFILAQLQKENLSPSRRAERRVLARRLSFALRGLPPSVDEVELFVNDDSHDAWEQLVDRWLASPSFGERWARHWMDAVRYTDTYGYEWDIPAKGAWRYRDYLTRAFNADVPFDQLIREQIAGDLLEHPRMDYLTRTNESLLGPMFFQLGEKRHGDSSEFDGIHQEMLDNKIDAFSKAFQATTISCARCHDHKLDAVAQREYYALAGTFMSSRWVANTTDLPERNAEPIAELKTLKQRIRKHLAQQWLADVSALARELLKSASDSTRVAEAGSEAVPVAGQTTAIPENSARIAAWRKLSAAADAKEPPLESPLYAWRALTKSTTNAKDDSTSDRWQAVAKKYADERAARRKNNQEHFREIADFASGVPEGWSVDGTGLEEVAKSGDFTVALDGSAIVGRVLPAGLYTNVLSPRLNGAIRTPIMNDYGSGHISFECAGGDFAAFRTVIDNAFLTEKQKYLNHRDPEWVLQWTHSDMKGRHNYIEFATKTSNPNFPPRVGLGPDLTSAEIEDPRSWFGVTRVVLHNAPFTPADELTRFESLFSNATPADLEGVSESYARWFGAAVARWSEDRATRDDVTLVNFLLDNGLLTNEQQAAVNPEIAALVEQYRRVERTIETPCTVNGMADLEPGHNAKLNIRGEYDQFGPEVARGYMRMLHNADGTFTSTGSGRKELAEKVADPANPLTARVFVNRVWHWLFGAGIVSTPDDFGHAGELPSHPELLDHLAAQFMAEGWSLKQLVREIVQSETWQQSNETTPAALAVDPSNRLLHHFPVMRLEAEPIRDAMLAVSGRLDARLYGPPIDPQRQNEDPQKRLVSGPVDGHGRRSIYTKITIMEPPRFLATFNQPTPKIPTGRRDLTNTPAQSLALLNDPFTADQAKYWGRILTGKPHQNIENRISEMFFTAYGRPPDGHELTRWTTAVADFAKLHNVKPEQVLVSTEVWTDVAHALFNTKEFIYVR